MSTESSTEYLLSFNIGADAYNQNGSMTFTDTSGMTDELALGFAKAVLALPWPAGSNPTFVVTKAVTDLTRTQGDPATGTFTAV